MSGEKLICQQPQTLTAFEKTPKSEDLENMSVWKLMSRNPDS